MCFLILEFKSLWGCQISGFESLRQEFSSRFLKKSGNPAGAIGAHNKISALDSIALLKQYPPFPV